MSELERDPEIEEADELGEVEEDEEQAAVPSADAEVSPESRRFAGRRRRQPVKLERIDYKDYETLRRFIDDRGKILPRRQTGLSAKQQRALARAIKRARHLALLPFTSEHMMED